MDGVMELYNLYSEECSPINSKKKKSRENERTGVLAHEALPWTEQCLMEIVRASLCYA